MNAETLLKELEYKAVRSSGPGGQHVNKTASKVEVSFHINNSEAITEDEKEQLTLQLSNKISSEGFLKLTSSETRSQHKNKELVTQRLMDLIEKNRKKPKPRKKTKPSKASKEKRLTNKKEQSTKKLNRKPPKID
ncbi:MAG: alternative ribosome rescue aminoacyl-tRNA hydrolase ArfB [Flavobacteriaceae bacterium]